MRPKGPKIPILMYHHVSELPEGNQKIRTTNPIYSLSAEQFLKQMEYINNKSYKTLTLNDLLDANGDTSEKGVIITFDDGWEDNYANAFPVLKKCALTATVFVITDFVGKANCMTWDNLKEMSQKGISIQSHTVTHRPLSTLNASEIKRELEISKRTIEDNLGTSVEILSAPHGMIDHRVKEAAHSTGYKAICTSDPGLIHSNGNPSILKRINISNRIRLDTFEKILEGDYFSLVPAICSKKVKNLTRVLVGYKNYRELYRFVYRLPSNR